MYRCEATSVEGFIQQLAVSYITNGYWFYVTGTIPADKDPRTVDRKLISRYGIDISKWTRCRRRKAGTASVQYLRYGHTFVLVATNGSHEFFAAEGNRIQDFRRVPLRSAGYSIGCRQFAERWHAAVRLDRETFLRLKTHFTSLAFYGSIERLDREFQDLRVAPYAAVRRQLFQLLRAVNDIRRRVGLGLVAPTALRLHRQSVVAALEVKEHDAKLETEGKAERGPKGSPSSHYPGPLESDRYGSGKPVPRWRDLGE